MTENLIRCFLAVPLHPDTINPIQNSLALLRQHPDASTVSHKEACRGSASRENVRWENVRWEVPCNWHLTLAFLGEQTAGSLHPLQQRLQETPLVVHAAAGSDTRLRSCRISSFPDSKSRIIALEFHPSPFVNALKKMLDLALAAQGFSVETRPFRPHVTLGRLKRDQVAHFTPLPCDIAVPIDQVCLFQSTPTAGGSVYQALWSLPVVRGSPAHPKSIYTPGGQ